MKTVVLLLALATPVLAQPIDWSLGRAKAITEGAAPTPLNSPKVQAATDDYTITALHQRADAFAWQGFASKIIFWLVVVLVVSGIAFSGIQFWFALRRGAPAATGEVNVSLVEGVKVRSQYLGVVTLALSLAFFYLYLKTVYPIEEVADRSATHETTSKE